MISLVYEKTKNWSFILSDAQASRVSILTGAGNHQVSFDAYFMSEPAFPTLEREKRIKKECHVNR